MTTTKTIREVLSTVTEPFTMAMFPWPAASAQLRKMELRGEVRQTGWDPGSVRPTKVYVVVSLENPALRGMRVMVPIRPRKPKDTAMHPLAVPWVPVYPEFFNLPKFVETGRSLHTLAMEVYDDAT